MMNALDLGFLAYERSDVVPDFIDGQEFPEISYGYVSVALEYDVVSGYPDGAFQPNKEITRAEMAVLLERTNRLKWQRQGASRPAGVIKSIEFDAAGKGSITVDRYGSSEATFEISSDLPISHGEKLIKASDLKAGDDVIFQVSRKLVIDGSFIDKSQIDPLTKSIVGFKFDIKLYNSDRVKGFYSYENGMVFASTEGTLNGKPVKMMDEPAVNAVRELLKSVNFRDASDLYDYQPIIKALGMDSKSLRAFEVQVNFAEGGYKGFSGHYPKKS